MPRVKRQGKQRRGYTGSHVMQLVHGHDFFRDGFGDDLDAMSTAWPILRDKVSEALAEWNRTRSLTPCVDRAARIRPWAWYRFECADEILRDEAGDVGLTVNGKAMSEFDYLAGTGELSAAELRRGPPLDHATSKGEPDDASDDCGGARGDS